MSAWGKSDNKSSDGTVALSAPSITFNAATGHAAGVYTSAGHPFQLGDPVVYSNGSGTSVVGLTSGSTYYVTNVTANTFMVASTEDRALRNVPEAIVSTDGIGSSHTFTLPLALGRGTLTGTNSTIFTEELSVGDIVRASSTGGNQEMIVIAVTSDTLATVINANPGTTLTAFADDSAYRIHEKPTFVSSVATTDFESTQVFGVRSDEIHGDQQGGYVSAISLQTAGVAKYVEVPAVTVGSSENGSDAAGIAVITAGAVSTVTVDDRGDGYEAAPTVTVETPRLTIPSTMFNTNDTITYSANHLLVTGDEVNFIIGTGDRPHFDAVTVNADTGAFNLSTEEVTSAAHKFITGDYVRYSTAGTPPTGLTSGNYYFIVKTGANTFKLAASYADAVATSPVIVGLSGSPAGTSHTFTAHLTNDKPYYIIKTGDTTFKLARTAALATAGTAVDITYVGTDGSDRKMFLTSGAPVFKAALGVNQGIDNAESGAVAHTGWVHRKVLTGRHAGRIQYEVLVALSKNGITSDAGDDTAFPED
jgi:hypothetical protein